MGWRRCAETGEECVVERVGCRMWEVGVSGRVWGQGSGELVVK